jgi:hypothetical protein
VAAADEKRDRGLRQGSVLELIDRDMRGQVVDAVQGLAERQRKGLRGRDADEQGTGQPRAGRDGERVDVRESDAGVSAGPLERRDHRLKVRTAGDLWHDSAESAVLVDAGRDRVREQGRAANDADAGLVARRLDPEDERRVTHRRPADPSPRSILRMINASDRSP